jgi:hypothetical protein
MSLQCFAGNVSAVFISTAARKIFLNHVVKYGIYVVNVVCGLCQTGHGVCDQVTRHCLCEAFWMQNLIVKHFGSGDSNCGECTGMY